MPERESNLEAKLRKRVEAAGGYCLKWESSSSLGLPDRVLVLPGGRTIYAEMKAQNGRLSAPQKKWRERFLVLDHEHVVIKDTKGLREFLEKEKL